MIKPRYLSLSLACLFFVACDAQEPNVPIPKTPEIKKQTEIKPAPSKPRQALDLSIDNITIDDENKVSEPLIETNSDLFNKLSKKQTDSELSISGKLLNDKNKDEDYLKTVDGAHINIKGNFD